MSVLFLLFRLWLIVGMHCVFAVVELFFIELIRFDTTFYLFMYL